MATPWELLRDALSQNEPITLLKNKITENAKFYALDKPGKHTRVNDKNQEELIKPIPFATIKGKLGKYLQEDKLHFEKTMDQAQCNNAVLLWASTEYTKSIKGKRRVAENIFEFEVCVNEVYFTFQRADRTIKEIHAANGTPVSD